MRHRSDYTDLTGVSYREHGLLFDLILVVLPHRKGGELNLELFDWNYIEVLIVGDSGTKQLTTDGVRLNRLGLQIQNSE